MQCSQRSKAFRQPTTKDDASRGPQHTERQLVDDVHPQLVGEGFAGAQRQIYRARRGDSERVVDHVLTW